MYYVDTSVLVAYYCPEVLTKKSEDFLMTHASPSISALTELEFSSAISKKVFDKSITKVEGNQLIMEFLRHKEEEYYTLIPVKLQHYRLAMDRIRQFVAPLRSLDAIHLAVAYSNGLKFVTADKQLAKSAKALAIDVLLMSHH